jgi:hypothetical protein
MQYVFRSIMKKVLEYSGPSSNMRVRESDHSVRQNNDVRTSYRENEIIWTWMLVDPYHWKYISGQ